MVQAQNVNAWGEETGVHIPMLSVERLILELGAIFLSTLTDVPDGSRQVSGVIIYDPRDAQAVPEDVVVLGVGFGAGEELRTLMDELGPQGITALVVREPVAVDEVTAAMARRHGVVILGLTPGASWTQLNSMISSLLTDDADGYRSEKIGGVPSGDLFAFANAVALLLGAPVTIEDRNCRVIAFSSGQEEADEPRVETILARKVPERYIRQYTEAGFFQELYSSDWPVHMKLSSTGEGFKDRTAIAIRGAGGEILGSIWAAVPEPLETDKLEGFRDLAKVAALHILRIRAGSDTDQKRRRAGLLKTALDGEHGAEAAMRELGIDETPLGVFAANVLGVGNDRLEGIVEEQALRQWVTDAIAVHLAAVHPAACVALMGETIYGALPLKSENDGEPQAVRLVEDLLCRLGKRTTLSVGIGQVVSGTRNLATGREGAERALRVQLNQLGTESGASLFSAVHVEAMILELRDRFAAGYESATGPVAQLWAHDMRHGTDFVETLRVWLDSMGDISRAADQMHVHPNTLRYRLRRLSDLAELDLTDPDARFAAQVLLRVVPEFNGRERQ